MSTTTPDFLMMHTAELEHFTSQEHNKITHGLFVKLTQWSFIAGDDVGVSTVYNVPML